MRLTRPGADAIAVGAESNVVRKSAATLSIKPDRVYSVNGTGTLSVDTARERWERIVTMIEENLQISILNSNERGFCGNSRNESVYSGGTNRCHS
jgi:hypothetical protein